MTDWNQITIFDLLEQYNHAWHKIPDNASVIIHGLNVINVLDCGMKREENITLTARGFMNGQQYWIGCAHGSNGSLIALMYARDFEEGEAKP